MCLSVRRLAVAHTATVDDDPPITGAVDIELDRVGTFHERLPKGPERILAKCAR